MFAIFKQEIKLNLKGLLIWAITVGGLGFVCVLMYQSMEGEVKDMADTFSNMGAFSEAFGMSTLSIATLAGFFATGFRSNFPKTKKDSLSGTFSLKSAFALCQATPCWA